MQEVLIQPQAGYVGLRICEPERFNRNLEYFTVELFDPEVRARMRVYAYEPSYLAAFFEDLAWNWRGWDADKSWESVEGECKFSATNDRRGHVDLTVSLRPSLNLHRWRFEGHVLIEAGQLDSVAEWVRTFVGK
jgi:hypothetical protein